MNNTSEQIFTLMESWQKFLCEKKRFQWIKFFFISFLVFYFCSQNLVQATLYRYDCITVPLMLKISPKLYQPYLHYQPKAQVIMVD